MISFLVAAQSKPGNLVLYQLTEQNGLSDNQVTCFFQDSKGFMWIGTKDGLNRYDGSVITSFKKRSNDSSGLAANFITAIVEDRNQHLWIGTTSGVTEFDPEQNSFHSYKDNDGITDLCFDKNGNLWMTSWGSLIKFNVTSKEFTKYTNQTSTDATSFRNNNRFNKIIIDEKGRIWLAPYTGLWQFSPATGEFVKPAMNASAQDLIKTMYKDHEGNIWLGFWNNGLKKFDPENASIIDIDQSSGNITGISEIKDPQGNFRIWCSGLKEVDPQTKIIMQHFPPQGESVEDYITATVFTSKDGLLWIGTDKGARIMDPSKQFFHHHFLANDNITPQNIVLFENKKLMIGGFGDHFLNQYDSNFNRTKTVLHQPGITSDNQIKNPAVLNIVRENDHSIWICTEEGLILFDEKDHSSKIFRFSENDLQVSTRNFINNVFIDSKGNHWIFPWRGGIWQLNVTNGKFLRVASGITNQNGSLKNFVVTTAVEDDNHNLWFSDLDEGVLFYDHTTGQFSKPTEKIFGSFYNLEGILIANNFIWSVKTGTVFRIDAKTKKIDQWPIPDEFNKVVTGFCQDKHDHIWITTSSGLLCFDQKDNSFRRYTSNDGLIENVLNGTIFCRPNGNIIYAAKNYLTEFNPAELLRTKQTPPVLITQIFSQNQSIEIKNNNGEKTIDLGHTYSNFIFNWAILNYSNPLQNRYYCKLDGVDKDWKFVGYTGRAQYSSLQPGRYVLHVKAATSEGNINEKGDDLIIIIHPPFWQTWWFILFSSIILLTVIIFIVSYISRRNLKERLLRLEKEQAIEKERNRISRDMHDDLGSGLTKIAIMSEVVKKQIHEPEKAKLQLENISHSSRELVDSLQDIIWVLNPKNDTLESLAAYIREYALKFFETFETNVQFIYPEKFPDVKLSEEQRRNIFLVIKESFNNIAKHAWCNKVSVTIEHQPGNLKIIIADDGKGFDQANLRQFGNGLINMQNRMKQVGGIYAISSVIGKGTITKIEIGI